MQMPQSDSHNQVAVIGDVHAEDELLETVLLHARQRGISSILCVGDIVDGQCNVDRCCELLRQHAVLMVSGNHDRWLLSETLRDLPHATARAQISTETLAYLEALSKTISIPSQFGNALLCHGLGANDMASVTPDDFGYSIEVNSELHALIADPKVDLILNGHTHRRMVRHFDGLTIINAGTLRRQHEPGFVIINLSTGTVSWIRLADPLGATMEPLGPALLPTRGWLTGRCS